MVNLGALDDALMACSLAAVISYRLLARPVERVVVPF
jgi:hypothetical protein